MLIMIVTGYYLVKSFHDESLGQKSCVCDTGKQILNCLILVEIFKHEWNLCSNFVNFTKNFTKSDSRGCVT